MPRKRTTVPRSVDGSIGGSVTVISGSIRNPDEADALSVELSIRDTEITMRAGEEELGNWPPTAVEIRAIDATSFEFIAEGDRLIFMPDDPVTFGESPLVGGHTAGKGRRKGRKSKKKPDDAEPRPARGRDSADEKRRSRRRPAVQEPSKEKPSKPSRQDRKAAARAARAEAARTELAPDPLSVVENPSETISDDEQRAVDAAPTKARRRSKSRRERATPGSESDEAPSREFKEKLHGAWIRSLDVARKYDILGLDRVPIDEGLRGQEHQHTWDHRVAVSSGPGSHICTICGKIRR